MSVSDFVYSFYRVFVSFFSCPFVSNIYMIALAGLGMIYIIKSILFCRRDS